ncbi:MAG: tautomerase family protein [Nostoc sp. ZfuVER08]|jgi:4-oxalocrotonate tautomerase|uniref:Tautomerase n=3 Tax=Nostocaceae TaxID=1162 RepID=A0A8J6ZM00_DESMC|nr:MULTISPECIES: 4-oxalocrotonate tautomerase family protein [Nostocaceae]MBL1197632.1 4-oxalocrotonate tautomerase family protein [Nostoc sp. GBBB01]MDZ8015401.1 4-oxalocrotonate tautomerase family protein [Nostoc sp. ZfuVER08]MDZ8059329.1 4-oxalocrotonate tautomerase family protein [Nostoc sp. EkiNYC01]MDZ8105654.1 4-oxalocrotonate tautomerase family protein [Nostoc sp. DedQUE12a]BAY74372.1 putative 4-oxalocrotonate tautomerase [Nostoc linckia NIES-25]
MPFITVQIAKGHSIEKKRQLVKAITDALVATLNSKPEWITIHIDEFERENWAVGGQLHSDKHSGRHEEKGR